jgi:hypothetical protein
MLRKLLGPKLSKRELAIIRECCRQVDSSMEKADFHVSLDPEIKEIQQDIKNIIKKLEPTI